MVHRPRAVRRSLAALVALALPLAAGAASAKAPPAQGPLQVDARRVEATVTRGRASIGRESGVPRALYDLSHPVAGATPEAMARAFLAERSGELRLDDPTLADLTLRATRRGRAGTVVRFEQRIAGIPVLAPDLAVTIDDRQRVRFVASGYQPGLALASTVPAVAGSEARSLALGRLGVEGALAHETTRLVVVPAGKVARLAWQVRVVPAVSPPGDWEALVDAASGEVFHLVNRALHVAGSGMVFDPDPLGAAHATYGSPGYGDGGDAATAQLNAARATRVLPDLTDLGGGTYKLEGPYAQIVDSEAPFKGLFTQAGTTFHFDRSQDAFEAVNAYFHIDQIMRHLNLTLGVTVMPYQYAGGVRFDPSGLNGTDNSHYLTSTGQLAFGEGGVDDAEDADVVIHELGHGLHDWLTLGGLSQVEGLSEGLGDYFAQSYSRSLGQWAANEAPYHWVFSWDGHNEFWGGRITNYGAAYPGGLIGQVHTDGQIWASSLMRIWNDVGRAKTDAAVCEGIAMTNSGSSQNDAAQAVLTAAIALGCTPAEIDAFVTHFQATGYDVSVGIDYVANAVADECPGAPANENGVLEPGEAAEVVVALAAAGITHTGVSGTLSTTTPGVTLLDATATWPDLAVGVATDSDAPHFRVALDASVACLSTIDFELSVTSDQAGPLVLPFSRPVGQPLVPAGLPAAIPDNSTAGVTSTLPVGTGVTLGDVNVRVRIDHPYVGDLHIKLRSPLGTEVILLDRPGVPPSSFGCADDDLDVTFDDAASVVPESHCAGTNPWLTGSARAVQLLSAFNGQSSLGDWVLTVSDRASQDLGSLLEWELLTTPPLPGACATCPAVTAVALPGSGTGAVTLGPARPNPFSRATEVAFRLARPGRATLRVYDVAGKVVATLVDGVLDAGPHTAAWDGRDRDGAPVAAGLYFTRLSTDAGGGTRPLLLLR